MYTVVLMAALTGGAETPDFHRRNGCNGGCYGSNGCSGYVSHGCSGGGLFGGHGCSGGLFGGHGCSGWGGCNGGYACNGCNGRRGLFGGLFRRHGCNGCNGCSGWNNCCGPVYGGCHGGAVYGGCHGGVVGGPVYGGCHGGVIVGGHPGGVVQPPPDGKKGMPDGKKDGKKKGPPPPPDNDTSVEAPATILVNLPANARLSVDGQPTQGNAASRVLVTPAIPAGDDYQYTLRAEIVRDGQTVAQTQNVTVRAGQQSTATFNFATGGVASR
jgi:uncharacterized protein (TIGR03000 family)